MDNTQSVTHVNPWQSARRAVKNGQLEVLRSLIEDNAIDPLRENSELLRIAAECQHAEIVAYLIPLSDPKAENSLALRWACEKPGLRCVELLLPHSDPKAENSAALRLAVTYGNYEAAKLLFGVSEPQKAFQMLTSRPGISYGRKSVPEKFMELWEEHKNQKFKQRIEKMLDNKGSTPQRTTNPRKL